MITGERRGVRRGMTVLGRLPTVPKPINLPSQKLENRGLDPNVEIVPKGTVTWGPSSPPVNSGPWGANAKPTAWGPNSARPSSAGSTRPTSAGGSSSSGGGGSRPADLPRPSSAGNQEVPPQNAWGPQSSRPSSASGPQVTTHPPGSRPRSAESSRPNGRISLLGSELSHAGPPPPQPWGPAPSRKPPEDPNQNSRFTLTTGDFPTLGSEKNPNLRPQQRDRSDHPDDRSDDRPPTAYSDSYPYEDGHPPGSRFNEADAPNVWARGPGPFRGPPNMEGGYGMPSNTWRREPHDHPEGEEHWAPNGPGPYPGPPPRFPNPEFLPQRFAPGFGRGGPDGYPPPQFMRPMNPERPPQFGPGMFHGPYEGYYGYPGYNVDEREMMIWGGPGYGGFHPDFSRHPMGPRPRHMNHPGFAKEGEGFHPEFRPGGKGKEGAEEFRREGPANKQHMGNEPKRALHPRPHGQRDWGNEEPMDFSRPVFEKENPPAKNHKVSFKTEPTVADVAILKKPPPSKDEEEAGSRVEESTRMLLGAKEEVAEEKVTADLSAAGVLGKAPVQQMPEEASPRGVGKGPGDQQKAKAKVDEKEWRPKLHLMDAKGQDDNVDVYDYEAQRARLKELAAQRARQLQREEEERIKEQKAKANAKLEELNRRSTAGVSTEAPAPGVQEEKFELVQREAELIPETQFGTFRPSDLQQEVKPQPRRQERKGNKSREDRVRPQQQQKKDVVVPAPASAEEEQALPSPVPQTPEEVQDQPQGQAQALPQKQSRPRGGQRGRQHQHHGKQMPRADAAKGDVSAEQQPAVEPAIESDSPRAAAEASSGNGPSTGNNGNRRRKVGRNPKNRYKNEGGPASASAPALEKSSSGEIHVESSKAPEVSSHSEGGESTTAAESHLPDERGSSRGGGGSSSGRKFQRRFPGKRPGSKPQDVRVSDKPEGLRWTPVRNVRNEISPDSTGEKSDPKEKSQRVEGEGSFSPRQPRSRRAEMERYTPKPVKQQGQGSHGHGQGQAPEENGAQARQRPVDAPQGNEQGFHKGGGRAWRQRPETPQGSGASWAGKGEDG